MVHFFNICLLQKLKKYLLFILVITRIIGSWIYTANIWIREFRMHANYNIPVKSHVDLGKMTPVFGRTQYRFGDVVLTWPT